MTQGWTIPDYNVRESKRARRVTIKVSSWSGLEVVVPVGFNRSEIPKLLQSKARWIIKNLDRTRPAVELARPDSISLSLLGETWQAEYSPSVEPLSVTERNGRNLLLTGRVEDPRLCGRGAEPVAPAEGERRIDPVAAPA